MARFWVGGTGNWSDTAHWASSSGGAGGQSVPGASDDVTFDANSFSANGQVVTLNQNADVKSFTASAITKTITMGWGGAGNNRIFNVHAGNLVWSSNITIDATANNGDTKELFLTVTAAGCNFTSNGASFPLYLIMGGSTGALSFQDNLTMVKSGGSAFAGQISTPSFGSVTVAFNGHTVSCVVWGGSNSNTVDLTNSTINISNTLNSGSHDVYTGTTINLTGTGGSLVGNGLTFNTINVTGTGTVDNTFGIKGALTCSTLTFGTTSGFVSVYNGTVTVTGTFTANGANATTGRIFVGRYGNNPTGSKTTISAATVAISNVDFQDITGGGAGTWSGTSVGDAGNNSGITFTAPVTRYWVGNGGNFSSTAQWSTSSGGATGASVPLVHDTIHFDANSMTLGAQTVTMDCALIGKVDTVGLINSPTFDFSTMGHIFAKSFEIGGCSSNWSSSYGHYYFPRASANFNPGTGTILTSKQAFTIEGATDGTGTPIGAVVLTGDIKLGDLTGVSVGTGKFDLNGHNYTGGGFWAFDYWNGATINLGSGTITLNGDDPNNLVYFATCSFEPYGTGLGNVTVNQGTSTFIFNQKTDAARTLTTDFSGGTLALNVLQLKGTTAPSSASNGFFIGTSGEAILVSVAEFDLLDPGTAKYIEINHGGTLTATTFNVNGQSGTLSTLRSDSSGQAATIASSNWTVSYMNIQDITASPVATVSGSVNVSGNTGITFVTAITTTTHLARDRNSVTVRSGVLNTDGKSIVALAGDPTTHVMEVSDGTTGSPNTNTWAYRDQNDVTTMFAMSSDGLGTVVPLVLDASGNLFIKST